MDEQELAAQIEADEEVAKLNYQSGRRESIKEVLDLTGGKFTCSCCGKDFDFSNSIDPVGAVDEWKQHSNKCYACGHGYCHCRD